jgi:hypothetical protein
MKGRTQAITHAVNEALFDVALILATGLFRATARTLPIPEREGPAEERNTCVGPNNHTSQSKTRGEKA